MSNNHLRNHNKYSDNNYKSYNNNKDNLNHNLNEKNNFYNSKEYKEQKYNNKKHISKHYYFPGTDNNNDYKNNDYNNKNKIMSIDSNKVCKIKSNNDNNLTAKDFLQNNNNSNSYNYNDKNILDKYFEKIEWENFDKNTEREWYDQDESGQLSLFNYNNLPDHSILKYNNNETNKKKHIDIERRKLINPISRKVINKMDSKKWEINQLKNSGVIPKDTDNDEDINNNLEENLSRVFVQVNDLRPQFLDIYNSNVDLLNKFEAPEIVKDQESEISRAAKKGSNILKDLRERNERTKLRENFLLSNKDNMQTIDNNYNSESKLTKSTLDNSKINTIVNNLENYKQKNLSDNNYTKGPKEENNCYNNITITNSNINQNKLFKETILANLKSNSNVKDNSEVIIKKEYNSVFNKSIKEQKEYLPIFSVKQELLQIIKENKVIIIVGETGSGKTTQLTQYLYEENYCKYGIIGCTQPRRVAAVSVAKRVSEEMNVKLGNEVGYSIRFEDITSINTKIKYMTDGVLLRESLTDPDLDKYSTIIMDEAHERSLNTDVLFGILKKVLLNRKDLKLIVTSATMNANKFSSFFGNAPIYNIPGRTHKVDIIYSKVLPDDYVEAAVQKALAVHLRYSDGDILIFMTGQEDIEATCLLLHERIEKDQNIPKMLLLPIYSQLPSDLQSKIFEKLDSNSLYKRKCIVATNIAETSLTLEGVKYVIDTGFSKVKVYNPKVGMDVLQVNPISQANANQRSGRAGRTGPGLCFRLYTDNIFKLELHENNVPEIQRTNLSNVILLLKSLNIEDLLTFDFMDPPPKETLLTSMHQLWMLGALDSHGSLTVLGRKMVEFPLDPTMSKMLITSDKYGCSIEVLIIVSMLSIQTIFYRPKEKEAEVDRVRQKFFISESDHLTMLNVYLQWKNSNYSSNWATENYIQIKSLKKVNEIKRQLLEIMSQQKLELTSVLNDNVNILNNLNSNGILSSNYNESVYSSIDLIRKSIASGFFHNCARLKGIGEYINIRTNIPCVIHPSSSIYSLGYTPDYVVYHELIMTNKEYMNNITVIEPEWLVELAPLIFSIRNIDNEDNSDNEEYNKRKFEEKTKEKILEIEAKMNSIKNSIMLKNKRKNNLINNDINNNNNSLKNITKQQIIYAGSSSNSNKFNFGRSIKNKISNKEKSYSNESTYINNNELKTHDSNNYNNDNNNKNNNLEDLINSCEYQFESVYDNYNSSN